MSTALVSKETEPLDFLYELYDNIHYDMTSAGWKCPHSLNNSTNEICKNGTYSEAKAIECKGLNLN